MKEQEESEPKTSPRELELADFVENAVVSLHWIGVDGKIIWANQAELDLLGYTREEYIGHNIAEFHVDHDVIEEMLRRLTSGENLSNYEARLRCKDGSIKQVLISSNGLFEDEQFIHTRCFTIDITHRKQAEDRINLLYLLTAALSEALTPEQVAKVIVEQAIAMSGASAGSIVLLTPDKTQLEILISINYAKQLTDEWHRFSVDSPAPLAESVRTEQPVWLRNREEFGARIPLTDERPLKINQAWAAIPLIVEKRCIGALGLSFLTDQIFDDDERAFIVALAQQCAQALERARLSEDARDLAVSEERKHLARDLHDSVSQSLFSIHVLAQTVPRLWEKDSQQAQEQLKQLATIAQAAMSEMRTLLLELRPSSLVKASLQDLVTQLITVAQAQQAVTISCHIELEQALPEDVHVTLYRIIQESLNNLVKHSQATQGSITLIQEGDHLTLRIRDNGCGFNLTEESAGLGLGIMRERAATIGAAFEVVSKVGLGTEIFVIWPLPL